MRRSDIGPLALKVKAAGRTIPLDACDDATNDAFNELGNINIYDSACRDLKNCRLYQPHIQD